MRVPLDLTGTVNIYLASKAIFLFAKNNPNITSIVCPGLGTGCGNVTAFDCATRMRMAYEDWYLGEGDKFPDKLFTANIMHEEEMTGMKWR